MSHWKVHFDVWVQEHGKEPKRHQRCILVEADDWDEAETRARPHATRFTFGPRVLSVDMRMITSAILPLDISEMPAGVETSDGGKHG